MLQDGDFGLPDPFSYLAGAAGKVVADAWTTAMLGLWNAGLWALHLVLLIVDAFLTPDLSEDGPGAAVYTVTLWIAGVLVLVMFMIQLGVAAIRRNAKSLATAVWGVGKFVVVWAGWVGYGTAVVAACGGLTRALMRTLLKVDSWTAWQPWAEFSVDDITDGTVATVLGLLGLFLWLAAIGHLLVMLTRAAALIVLTAMTPATAAGLVGDAGREWFWKSLRWFHAAAFTPVLMVLMLGVGTQLTTGVANGLADTTQRAIGTALPGVMLIVLSCFSPLALFKLLAFMDPTTNSGAALRNGLEAAGGIGGLLGGDSSSARGTGGANRSGGANGSDGRSQGEAAADDSTQARFTQAEGGLLTTFGGAAGPAAAKVLGTMQHVGSRAAAVGSDLTNQMGVGHTSYQPDVSADGNIARGSGQPRTSPEPDSPSPTGNPEQLEPTGSDADNPTLPPLPSPNPPAPPALPTPVGVSPAPPPPGPPTGNGRGAGSGITGSGSGSDSTAAGSAGPAGSAEVAAAVPIVPV